MSQAALARPAMPIRPRPALLLIVALLLVLLVAVQAGAVAVSWQDWSAPFLKDAQAGGGSYVLWNIRLPRALFSILIGAALALAGALTQGLFRNPLADPGLLGISSGAACAGALTIVLSAGLHLAPGMRIWLLPAAAFCGAMLICAVLDKVARWATPGSIVGLLLTGVALNAVTVAVMGLCVYIANDDQLRTITFWTLGSLAAGSWLQVGALLLVLAAALWAVRYLTRAMNALALGEAAAMHVGIDVGRLRTQVVLLVALLTGIAIAWCGGIGFIGLIGPHLVRTWLGADQRKVLPLSMLAGGLLLLVADTLARTVAIPAEVPVGIFTALLGGPFFLMLLRRFRHKTI
ncbi:FecCD family ABC transporter permease [Janthinobacterium agaricidamnosum]|uniref:FecCD transport family protein n=1 Tax=Janthinobacterium agaricidamnosum NBRC 102515 = DSM 9628 TaxID=1349767 RepID=W0VB67_9BURK|nr:iron ABC transporter permease [Janthinobacterium agaricidamnosum]CDG84502.1 fecCD transport family protein [Janthinobacterium agaricidamnosum NBRC 102515 = DSM 9628]